MPWRNKYIAPRRHPLALSAYSVIFLLGFLFIIGVFKSAALDQLLGSEFWRVVWEWLLTIGGGFGLVGALWRRDLEDGLWAERLGDVVSMFGLFVYAGALTSAVGFEVSTWLLLGVLALGCIWRAVQITREIWRIKVLARKYMDGEP